MHIVLAYRIPRIATHAEETGIRCRPSRQLQLFNVHRNGIVAPVVASITKEMRFDNGFKVNGLNRPIFIDLKFINNLLIVILVDNVVLSSKKYSMLKYT